MSWSSSAILSIRAWMLRPHRFSLIVILTANGTPLPAAAQGTLADYVRADGLGNRLHGLVVDIAERPSWIGETTGFW